MSTVYIIYGVQLRNWNWIGADVRSNTKFPNIIDVVGGEAVLLMLGAVIVILPRLFSVWWCRLVLLLILLSIPFIWCFGKKRVGSNWTTALCFIAYGLVQSRWPASSHIIVRWMRWQFCNITTTLTYFFNRTISKIYCLPWQNPMNPRSRWGQLPPPPPWRKKLQLRWKSPLPLKNERNGWVMIINGTPSHQVEYPQLV